MNRQDVLHVVEMLPILRDFIIFTSETLSTPKEYADNIINQAELRTLQTVGANQGMKITDLATDRDRTLSAASRKVDKLVEKGYLEKRKTADNKKNICLFLTAKGERILAAHTECSREKLEREAELILEKYTVEQLDLFFEIIKDMHRIVEEENR